MTPYEVLSKAELLLAEPSAWTQGAFARKDGKAVPSGTDDADCFCVVGACSRAVNDSLRANAPLAGRFDSAGRATDEARATINQHLRAGHQACLAISEVVGGSAHVWNDREGRTHADVLAAVRKAKELAQ